MTFEDLGEASEVSKLGSEIWNRKPNIDIMRFQECLINTFLEMYILLDFENLTEYNGFLTEV